MTSSLPSASRRAAFSLSIPSGCDDVQENDGLERMTSRVGEVAGCVCSMTASARDRYHGNSYWTCARAIRDVIDRLSGSGSSGSIQHPLALIANDAD